MIQSSVEVNKALEDFIEICDTLGKPKDFNVCEIEEDAKIRAAIKFLKIYELCVRADEALGDLLRHKATSEIKGSLERTRDLLVELTKVVKSLRETERGIILSKLTGDFYTNEGEIARILKQRPGARIWDGAGIADMEAVLSKAIEELRKSAAYSLLLVSSTEEAEKYLGKLFC